MASKAARRAIAPDHDAPIGPTPETAAKLRYDVIAKLYLDGKLDDTHVAAAQEIRRVWEAIGRGLFPRARQLDRIPNRGGATRPREPADLMSQSEAIAWRDRYRPFATEMSVDILSRVSRVSRLQLTLDIVIDNYGLRQVEDWYRLKHGVAAGHLRTALERYAVLAGWVERRQAPEQGTVSV